MRLVLRDVVVDLSPAGDGTIGVRFDGRIQLDGNDGFAVPSMALDADAQAPDFGAAGRHGNHVRWGRPDPGCELCTTAEPSPSIAPDRQAIAPESPPMNGDASDISDLRSPNSEVVDPTSVGSAPSASLIDLDREDVAALKARGWKRLGARQLALLDHIAADPLTGASEIAGQAWSGAVIRDAARKRGTKYLELLVATYEALKPAVVAAPIETPTPARTAPSVAVREVMVRELEKLEEAGTLHPGAAAMLERLRGEATHA